MAEEVGNLKERVTNLANTEFNGRYVFSGTAYDTPPFDSTYTYAGTTTEVSIDVSVSAKAEVGFDGSDVFQGSVDVFTAIDNLITGLNTDDSPSSEVLSLTLMMCSIRWRTTLHDWCRDQCCRRYV